VPVAQGAIETETNGGAGKNECALHQPGERFRALHRLLLSGIQRGRGAVH